jgi:hypothetical protein
MGPRETSMHEKYKSAPKAREDSQPATRNLEVGS